MLLPDDLIIKKNCSKSMINVHQKYKSSVMASMQVNKSTVSRWGIYNLSKRLSESDYLMRDVVEKPTRKDAQSNKAVIGRKIVSNTIFKHIKNQNSEHEGEIHIPNEIKNLIEDNTNFIFFFFFNYFFVFFIIL